MTATPDQIKKTKKLVIAIEWLKANLRFDAIRRETDEAKLERMRADLERMRADLERLAAEVASRD